MRGRFKIIENVEYVLRDKNGNIKPLFQENGLARLLVGKLGILSPHWINGPFASFLSPFLGTWAMSRKVSNLVTTVGKAAIAARIIGTSVAAFSHIAVGTGTTGSAVTDTALQAEITDSGLARAAATVSQQTTDHTNDTARLTVTFSVTGSKAVTESGILNASSGGTLGTRQVFSAVNVVNGDALQVTWDLDVD